MVSSITSLSSQIFLSSAKTKPQDNPTKLNAGTLASGENFTVTPAESHRSNTIVLKAGRGTIAAERAAHIIARDTRTAENPPPSLAEAARKAFQTVDANGDKKVTLEELNQYCSRHKECITNDSGMSDTDKSAALQEFDAQEKLATAIFNKFSVNGELDTNGLGNFIHQLEQYLGGVDTTA
jgi:hypothetical protein